MKGKINKRKRSIRKRWWHEPLKDMLKTIVAVAASIFIKKKIK